MQAGEEFDDERGPVAVEGMQGVGKLARPGSKVFQHQHEPAGDRSNAVPWHWGTPGSAPERVS